MDLEAIMKRVSVGAFLLAVALCAVLSAQSRTHGVMTHDEKRAAPADRNVRLPNAVVEDTVNIRFATRVAEARQGSTCPGASLV
jgi:hypothetical protein